MFLWFISGNTYTLTTCVLLHIPGVKEHTLVVLEKKNIPRSTYNGHALWRVRNQDCHLLLLPLNTRLVCFAWVLLLLSPTWRNTLKIHTQEKWNIITSIVISFPYTDVQKDHAQISFSNSALLHVVLLKMAPGIGVFISFSCPYWCLLQPLILFWPTPSSFFSIVPTFWLSDCV